MKIKKTISGILIFVVIIAVGELVFGIRNYYRVAEDTEPILLFDYPNQTLIYFYLQRDMEAIEIPLKIRTGGGVVLNTQKRDEIVTEKYGEGIAKYNFVKDEIEGLLTYDEKNQITGGGVPKELQFLPDENSISFCVEKKIYTYNFDNKDYKVVYEYDKSHRMGFPYKWKNASEMYLIESDNLILYNIETKEKEIIYEGLGRCYFHMSQGEEYLVYQPQRGRKQKIFLLNLKTGEKKVIHRAKSDARVDVAFSSDGRYIFFMDFNKNSLFDPRYWYLYDLIKNRKFSVDIGDKAVQLVGWD